MGLEKERTALKEDDPQAHSLLPAPGRRLCHIVIGNDFRTFPQKKGVCPAVETSKSRGHGKVS